jgi:hypothetical protein
MARHQPRSDLRADTQHTKNWQGTQCNEQSCMQDVIPPVGLTGEQTVQLWAAPTPSPSRTHSWRITPHVLQGPSTIHPQLACHTACTARPQYHPLTVCVSHRMYCRAPIPSTHSWRVTLSGCTAGPQYHPPTVCVSHRQGVMQGPSTIQQRQPHGRTCL